MKDNRIECGKKKCRRIMRESELVKVREGKFANSFILGCPECSEEGYYVIGEPCTNARIDEANELIRLISSYGRKFFQHKGFVSTLELGKRGQVLFVDYYTRKRIVTNKSGDWQGFTSGGTLRGLVEMMRDYIKTGRQIPLIYIGLPRKDGSNIWGYEDSELEKLIKAVKDLAMIDISQS